MSEHIQYDPREPETTAAEETAVQADACLTPEQQEMELYELAVEHFGETAQILMVIEEMAELIQALNKYIRYLEFDQGNYLKIIEKISHERADVELTLRYLDVIFGDNSDADCAALENLAQVLA